ncbi:MAG TPA: protein kinase [Vicinamibacterales bacterium]|nr:protein kinase [Vicinamibacterales bacterium]
MIGTTIGHYRIDALLGRGGMGAVYRARDLQLDRTVALKVLAGDPGDAQARARLVREARAASALNHPNVVTVHAVEQQPEFDCIVMEWIDGVPLGQAIPPGGFPVDTFLDYAVQIAGALAAAHEAGIVHRDVKPSNISVTRTGVIKVFDFGIARRLPLAQDDTRAATIGATLAPGAALTGTPGYMAPEQIAGQPADPRSDVFALGAVLYEMLAGAPAFPGESDWARLDATIHRDPPPLAARRPDVPAAVAAIVSRALSRTREERYPSAAALLEALSAVRDARRRAPARSWPIRTVAAIVVLIALAGAAVLIRHRVTGSRLAWARDTATVEARRLAAAGEPFAAFRLLQRALASAPEDPQVKGAWTDLTRETVVDSVPPGAEVAVRPYAAADEAWLPLGITPLRTRLPLAQMRWRFSKAGYETVELSPNVGRFTAHLPPAGSVPPGMVYVPQGEIEFDTKSIALPPFWIDRFEVTNREYKVFVDAGGYRRRELWTEPFVKDGRTQAWDEAMAAFRDSTGRPGPSTWELGSYPEGHADVPVSGVSWYEAAAYARYAGKTLPTLFHWRAAARPVGIFSDVLDHSNFGGRGPEPVGRRGGLGPFGTYDMAGNVKEWCWNATRDGRRYILGGGWNEPKYMFHDLDARSPWERGPTFGIRLMRQPGPVDARLLEPIAPVDRDPARLRPVSDDVYEAYRRLYDYDPTPLDARVEETTEYRHWRREIVSVRAAYGNERVPVQLYLPRAGTPPYQAVVYFPGADAVRLASSRELWLLMVDFLVRSGRVLVYPIYQQTYERRRPVGGPDFVREISIHRGRDLRRTIDYLETRRDIDARRIAFYGLSLGAQLGPVYLAIEPRLRTGVLLSGGFETWTIPAETDPVHFAPRVKQPVLMVNGREDFDLPYETAQLPLFRALGSRVKKHVVLEGGHIPPRPQEVYKVVLDWLDEHLGPVR